jgi:hypothetical protein
MNCCHVLGEMNECYNRSGSLFFAFHMGIGTTHEQELWGHPISMDFSFSARGVRRHIEAAGFAIEEIIEREPYSPEVEYQSRRAYIFATKPVVV